MKVLQNPLCCLDSKIYNQYEWKELNDVYLACCRFPFNNSYELHRAAEHQE
jgi:hypothetical protein